MVCERVEPLFDIEDLDKLIKIFPTFWSILKETDYYNSSASLFKEVIVDTVREMLSKSRSKKCERCWHYENDIGSSSNFPTLCGRCVDVMNRIQN